MPNGPVIHPRLSNLGIASGTTSGQTADSLGVDPRLEALIGATDQIAMLQQQAELGQQEVPGVLERLLSPGGLATLGVGAGAAALGAPEVGGSLMSGLLQGVQAGHQQEKQALLDQVDTLQSEVDKQRQRLVTLLQAQPGLFLDPQGSNVINPQLLGPLAGLPVPVSPAANFAAGSRGAVQKETAKTLGTLLQQADTPEARRSVVNQMNILLDLNLPEEAIDVFAIPSGMEQTFDTLAEYFDINSLADAMLAAETQGVSLTHPDIMPIYMSNLKPEDVGSASDEYTQRILEAADQFTAWLNTTEGAPFRSEDTAVAVDAWLQATGSADMAGYLRSKSGFKGGEELTNKDIMTMMMPTMQKFAQLDQAIGGGFTDPARRDEIASKSITQNVGVQNRIRQRATVNALLTHQARIRAALREQGMDDTDAAFSQVWDSVMKQLGVTQAAKVDPTDLNDAVNDAIRSIEARGQGE